MAVPYFHITREEAFPSCKDKDAMLKLPQNVLCIPMVHRVHVIACGEGKSQKYSNQKLRILRSSQGGWLAKIHCDGVRFQIISRHRTGKT